MGSFAAVGATPGLNIFKFCVLFQIHLYLFIKWNICSPLIHTSYYLAWLLVSFNSGRCYLLDTRTNIQKSKKGIFLLIFPLNAVFSKKQLKLFVKWIWCSMYSWNYHRHSYSCSDKFSWKFLCSQIFLWFFCNFCFRIAMIAFLWWL